MKKTYQKPVFIKTSYISIDNMADTGYGFKMESIDPTDDLLMKQYGICVCPENIDDCGPTCSCV